MFIIVLLDGMEGKAMTIDPRLRTQCRLALRTTGFHIECAYGDSVDDNILTKDRIKALS